MINEVVEIFTVYALCSPEGKIYVGQTKQPLNRRFRNGFGYRNNEVLFEDIIRFGWKAFQQQILWTGDNQWPDPLECT